MPRQAGRRLGRGAYPQQKFLVALAVALLMVSQYRSPTLVTVRDGLLEGRSAQKDEEGRAEKHLRPQHFVVNTSKVETEDGSDATFEMQRCPEPFEFMANIGLRGNATDGLPAARDSSLAGLTGRLAGRLNLRRRFGRRFSGWAAVDGGASLPPQQRAYDDYKARIDAKIESLPSHGTPCPSRIAYWQEFGYEVQGVLPWYYDEHIRLRCDLNVKGMPGSRYLYFWSKNWTEEPSGHRTSGYLPLGNPMGATPHVQSLPTVNWTMPPFSSFFGGGGAMLDVSLVFPRPKLPVAVIFNKYTKEPDVPYNFLDVDTLRSLLTVLSPVCQVVYVRMEAAKLMDRSESVPFRDKEMIRAEYPNTVLLDDVYNETTMDYNLLLFGISARSSLFVSVQGGNSVIASLWGVPNFIYAVKGREIGKGGFAHRWYGKLSGCDVPESLVTVYDRRTTLVKDVWRWLNCGARDERNGTVVNRTTVGYIPVQGPLVERAAWEKGFDPDKNR